MAASALSKLAASASAFRNFVFGPLLTLRVMVMFLADAAGFESDGQNGRKNTSTSYNACVPAAMPNPRSEKIAAK